MATSTTDEAAGAPQDRPADREVKSGVQLPPKVSEPRGKLGRKAKQEPKFRFYTLYDRIYRRDVLTAAWWLVEKNDSAPGVDGMSCGDIVNGPGAAAFLDALQEELRSERYRPQPVKRVYISKDDGKLRPLGIPTIKDRIVQTATLLILEPIFEADFLDCSFGFRPGKSAHQAVAVLRAYLAGGLREVYDADLQAYFDTIPHEQLLKCLQMRIADRTVLHLIRMWLEAPVVEQDEAGHTKVTRPKQGTPQGGVISPLLANIYLHWFDKAFHGPQGLAAWAKAKLVRYADDFVILARHQTRRLRDWVEGQLEGRFRLAINRKKTRVVDMKQAQASINFLGFTFRYDRDLFGRATRFLNVFPSQKALARLRERLRELTWSNRCHVPIPQVIAEINQVLRGWANYFALGYPRRAFRQIDWFVQQRLYRHLRRRSQRRRFRVPEGMTFLAFMQSLGLQQLGPLAGGLPVHA